MGDYKKHWKHLTQEEKDKINSDLEEKRKVYDAWYEDSRDDALESELPIESACSVEDMDGWIGYNSICPHCHMINTSYVLRFRKHFDEIRWWTDNHRDIVKKLRKQQNLKASNLPDFKCMTPLICHSCGKTHVIDVDSGLLVDLNNI